MSHAPDLPMPHAGDILGGRYILRERIGAGGMGRVFRARDEVLARDVAIKIFHLDGGDDPAPIRRLAEARALAALDHPSLVTLYDARLGAGDHVYLVMELIEGPSLRRRIEDGPIPVAEVAGFVRDLAGALAVVHEAGIVHRDVKPSNVLLRPVRGREVPFEAVLADFGVAHLIDATRLTTPGTVIGTAAYLAPEQVRGEAPRAESDVYALGLLAIEALTRLSPFGAGTLQESVLARLARQPEVPAGFGYEWRSLLTAMTATDPDARPRAADVARRAAELAPDAPAPAALGSISRADDETRALEELFAPAVVSAASTPVPARETTAATAPGLRARRERAARGRGWVWAGAAAAAAVVVGGHVLAFSLGSPGGATTDRQPAPTSSATPALAERSAPDPTPSQAVLPVSSTDADTPPAPSAPVDVVADPIDDTAATTPSAPPPVETTPTPVTPVAPESGSPGGGAPTSAPSPAASANPGPGLAPGAGSGPGRSDQAPGHVTPVGNHGNGNGAKPSPTATPAG